MFKSEITANPWWCISIRIFFYLWKQVWSEMALQIYKKQKWLKDVCPNTKFKCLI